MTRYRDWYTSAALLQVMQVLLAFVVLCRAMPHFTSTPYTVTVSEATPVGTILINVTAIPGTPRNTLSYIIFNNPPIFQIDNITGSIYLVGMLDYEQVTSHVFNVEVKEQSDVVMTQVTVHVTNENDNPLTCDQTLVVVSIPEGPPSPSSIPLSCVDRDELSGSISYQIMSGNDTGLFSIDIDGSLHIIGDLDYEQHTLHEVIVNASGRTPSTDSTLLLTVLIVVEPRNEYSPKFENDDEMFTFSVSESATIGTTVGAIHATDADEGVDGDLIFSTVSPSTQGLFSLQPSTGQLVLTQSLDYEQATLYELTVTVSDSSPDTLERLTATAIVTINISDVNEYDPIFSQEVYSVIVSEDETVDREIISVECADNDSDSTVSYSIESGNDANHFSIDPTTGTVMLVSVVDYDPDSSLPFQLVIQCEDSGSPSRSAQSTLIISVEGHNRNLPPSLSVEEYTVNLGEDSSLGTTVVSLASIATDANRGLAGPLQFSLDHNLNCPQDIFLITPTGTVYLVGFVDHETSQWYVCEVSVSNRESTASATLNIFISVTDINDEVPLCLETLYTLSIPEDSAVGSDLLTLSCSDADSDTLEYFIVGTSHTFQVTQSGVLSLLTQVDSDVLSTHNFYINVSDGLYAVQLSVFIYVESSNEAAPTFNQTVYDCSLPEDTDIGSTICRVTATDIDSGPDGDITYSIVSGNDDNIFAINSWSGEVVLAGYIDYEMIQGYVILVCASDSADLPLSSSVQVRISVLDSNDNAPIISPLISTSIEENSAVGSAIVELECSDVDSGSNGDVTLTIHSSSSVNVDGLETEETGIFMIDSSTRELVLDTTVDFESSILYTLTIMCTDNGILPLTSSSTVLVSITPLNEFAPVLSQENYYVSVSESSDIGTSILQITATDNDKGIDGNIEYSIESSESGVNFLQISATSGNILTQQLPNCDWGRAHDFTIIASDRGSPVLTSQSQLHITFENCQLGQLTPQQAIYFADIMENSPMNTEVITVGCDTERMWENSAPEYGIVSPEGSPFQIDPLVGQISIFTPPDYEQATSYMLQLNCTDPSSPHSYTYFTAYITILSENEHPPEFIHSIYDGEIAEDVSPGTSVLQVQANDDDSDIDGRVVFSIYESVQSFTVDSITGVIYTLASLDREEESFYSFHVVVVDQLGQGDNMHSSMTEIQVNVRDTNDNAPLCDRVVYHATISPLVNVGYRVLSLECTDADTDLNSELHYSLQSESPNSLELFSLNENTGDLMLAREFDASSALTHQMIITVEDGGVPSLSTAALVVVEVESLVVMKGEVDGESLAEVEGVRNALELTLKDMPIEQWTSVAKESFQRAMAHSVTIYCALWPEACSLLSGCAHFYRGKRSSREYFYTVFSKDNVVILPNSTLTFTGGDGSTNLNLTFYVTLPEGVQRSDYRTTDYVIPGSTLSIMLQGEQPVIEAQVRDNITSSLRAQKLSGESGNMNWVWAVVTSIVVVVSCVFVAITIAVCTFKWIFQNKKKGGATIAPLNMTSRECTNTSEADIPSGARIKKKLLQKNGKRLITLRDLVNTTATSTRLESSNQTDLLTQSEEKTSDLLDDVSTIFLESTECSLQGQPRSNNTASLSSEGSSNSAGNREKSGQRGSQDSLGDYKQNFPFEPPRQAHTRCDGFQMKMSFVQPPVGAKRVATNNVPPWN